MAYPTVISAANGRAEAEARRQGKASASQHVTTGEAPVAATEAADSAELAADAPAASPHGAPPNADLVELGTQFGGLTRLLDEISAVGRSGLSRTDVDAMLTPVFGVLKGVMNRIIGAPAATLSDLGIKAQVVMWGNRDWWDADAKLGWQAAAMKAFVEQTVAAAGLKPPQISGRRAEPSDPAG